MSKEHVVETDVLVIGGGLAGCFAAIKAKEQGVDVTLVDKGYVSKSGSSIWPHTYSVFNPEWGHKLDDWMDHINTGGEYLNNRVWTEIIFKESYARYQDLVSYGVEFRKDENGKLYRWKMAPQRACESLEFHIVAGERRAKSLILRKQALKRGVKIMDRIMITDLLQQDGRVIGVVGFSIDSGDLYIFKAKATVISAGAAAFKPSGWPISELTGDGQAMAYRAGVELIGNEFLDTHGCNAEFPYYGNVLSRDSHGTIISRPWYISRRSQAKIPEYYVQRRRKIINAEGDEVPYRRDCNAFWFELEFEAHAGRTPVYRGETRIVGCAAGGMANHTSEGAWPINTKCATTLPGLYAAGDSLGTMQVGSVYSTVGVATAGASVTGARAGFGAAEYALKSKMPTVDEEELTRLKKTVEAPLERKGGFSPRWVTQVLQNITKPYFMLFIKHGKRMEAALTLVEFMKDHLAPKLFAKDPHELRLAHETKNMILNAEIKLRSSLFRTESRGWFYREDYPRRDDPNWLAWIKLKEEKGKMKLWKEPIPKEWWPDLSKPYEERYPARFPGE